MKVYDLIKVLNYQGNVDNIGDEITGFTCNSKEVVKGNVFFAVKGTKVNGNDYIDDAFSNGAVLVVSDSVSDKKGVITVKNIRNVIGKIVYNFYNFDIKRLKIIAVVGTNGKTSTTYLIKNILTAFGKNVGVIGTLGIYFNRHKIAPELTTPDAICLSKILKDMANEKVEYVVMELSAHAIEQKRAYGLKFEALVFTNCTHDHLDYFKDFYTYKKVKQSVFNKRFSKIAVVNSDDEAGREIILSEKIPIISYGLDSPSDVFAIDIKQNKTGSKFVVNALDDIEFVSQKLLGKFNIYNTLAAISVCMALGVDLKTCVSAINNSEAIPGRLEFVESYNGADIYVDYAHTPDGLKKVLETFSEIYNGKIILLFGCGGNRDKEKRSEMGKIAGEYADFTVVTSDNPRYEEPYSIIREIEKGLRDKTLKYITIQNRYMATGYAVSRLKSGDVLIIAGKGAENYQDVMGVKLNYNDKEAVRDIIAKLDFGGELI